MDMKPQGPRQCKAGEHMGTPNTHTRASVCKNKKIVLLTILTSFWSDSYTAEHNVRIT